METHLFDIPSHALHHIFRLLPSDDWARASCACTLLRATLAHDESWHDRCVADFATPRHAPPASLSGAPLPTYRAAYADRAAVNRLYPAHFRRACAAWSNVEAHLAAHFPGLLPSLAPGATEAALDEAEAALDVRLPPDLRALYRIHNGQRLTFDDTFDSVQQGTISDLDASDPSLVGGLLGGYLVYDKLTSTRLLPLARIIIYTRQLRHPNTRTRLGATHLLLAASFLINDKIFVLDTTTGALHCNHPSSPAHPPLPDPAPAPGTLTWFERYASRLAAGTYTLEVCPINNGRYLSLFPVQPPEMSESVTRGVRIRASALYIPGNGNAAHPRMEFFYSIRMALLSEEEQERHWAPEPAGCGQGAGGPLAGPAAGGCPAGARRVLRTVQLSSRHWKIKDGDKPLAVVSGDGVIGEYPLLEAGGPEFVYQSRTVQYGVRGYMEGHFTFVEGSLRSPVGGEFAVACPRFELFRPDFLF